MKEQKNLIMNNYDDEIEKAILTCLILKPKLFEELLLNEKYFLKHSGILKFYKKIYLKYQTLDTLLITKEAPNSSNAIDFTSTLLTESNASVLNFHAYEEQQLQIYKKTLLEEKAKRLSSNEISVQEFLNSISELNEDNLSITTTPNEDYIYNLITGEKESIKFNRLKLLENKVKFIKNTFNVIAARPSVGKSAFALNMIEDLSKNYRCIYFNMEMTEKEMYERLVAINTEIPMEYFTQASRHQQIKIIDSIHELTNRKLKIINGSKNIQAMKNLIINEQKKEHTLVFIDYVGYVMSMNKLKNDRERIGEIVRELQLLSKDYNITIFCLAQINRDGTDEPTKENLKDSGELEQTGHAVLLLHNSSADPLKDQEPLMKVIVAKNRSGRTGYLNLRYIKNIQKFVEEKRDGIEKYSRDS